MHDSIFMSSVRSFFVALFVVFGICVGFVPVLILLTSVDGTASKEIEATYSSEILANAKGDRVSLGKETPVILQIDIKGIIGTELLSMETIREQLLESREGDFKDNRVKAILLSINSPGGTVVDSDGIYRALKAYKEQYKVPIYAYVDGLCASGGMYIASAADKVYASDSSLIGSVGVISPAFLNFSKVLTKVGIDALTLSAGKGKDDMNPLRPWRPGEQDSLQAIINYYYEHFVDVVTSNRPLLDKTKLVSEYGANIFNPKQAQEYGFITASGYNVRDTLTLLLKDIGIADDKYQVMRLTSKSWFSSLFKGQFSLLKGQVTHTIQLAPELDPKLMGQFLYLYSPEGH